MDEQLLFTQALTHDDVAMRRLVAYVLPVVQARVARVLVRQGSRSTRDVRQDVEDIVQDVLMALFDEDARILRMWEPTRGMSLKSFCGLIAERETASILRSGRRSPWKESATQLESLERELDHVRPIDLAVVTKQLLDLVYQRVQASLSVRGFELFQRLIVDEEAIESICQSTGMTPDAVYAWKSRLAKVVRKIATEVAQSAPRLSAAEEASSSAVASSVHLPSKSLRDESSQ